MNIINFLVNINLCSGNTSIQPILHMVKVILDVVRIIVPIGLVVMTSLDVAKKVINPDDKDGQKKIMIRAIAALIVFLLPTIVNLSLKIVDWGTGKDVNNTSSSLSSCWKNA